MIIKLLILWCFLMFPEMDTRYSAYHKPRFQNAKRPWYGVYDPIAVQPLYDEKWAREEEIQHLLNMSLELLKDVNIKNRHSVRIQRVYEQDPQYKLGLLTSASIDKFNHMVRIFRYYVRPEVYDIPASRPEAHKRVTDNINQAYQIMQGDYNEMRLECELYHQLVANVEKVKEEKANEDKKPLKVVDLKEHMSVDEWHSLNEIQQAEKLAALQAMYAGRLAMMTDTRRSMAGSFKRTKLLFTPDAAEEEFKRSLRYQKWAEKWNGFNPKVEGIEISRDLARMGRNMSKFLGVNAF